MLKEGGMVNRIRRGTFFAFVLLGISAAGADAQAQAALDTMRLAIVPPDSVYVRRDGAAIVVGWYPPAGEAASVSGSRDFTNWYVNDPAVSRVGVFGIYRGTIDRTVKISRIISGSVPRDTVAHTPSIRMLAELRDRFDSYSREFNLGSLHYTAGSPIPLVLRGQRSGVTLDLGISLTFGNGVVDTTFARQPAYFEIDLQTFEGFHIWRGLSPVPSRMLVISELSRDDAYLGIRADSLYFREWPKLDGRGRPYYEFVDRDVFVGFTYFYHVTCFDKGYFKGRYQFNKRDNEICDEDPENPATPGYPVDCEEVAHRIVMTVDARDGVDRIYAVPNPYRTGTSAATSPYYHNFPDESVKFFNMPGDAEIKIYTVSGDLVWQHHHASVDGTDGVVSWNVKNKDGGDVCSGVYIYRVEVGNGQSMYGRIVVIR
jgi:hypothetical protein